MPLRHHHLTKICYTNSIENHQETWLRSSSFFASHILPGDWCDPYCLPATKTFLTLMPSLIKTRSFQRCSENLSISISNWCFYSKLWSKKHHTALCKDATFAALEPLFSNQTSVGTPQRFSTCNLRLLWQPEHASNIITNQNTWPQQTQNSNDFEHELQEKGIKFCSSALFSSHSYNSKFN